MGFNWAFKGLISSGVKLSGPGSLVILVYRPVFTHGPAGPGPRAADFQGRHIKKIEIEVWYAEKKGCPRERNFREIYTENNVGTEWNCRYF